MFNQLELAALKSAYKVQKNGAKGREIEFLLTFEEWLKIWVDSGHLYERGRNRGQYVMLRSGDKGPYSVENVRIALNSENVFEAHSGKKCPQKGRSLTEKHKQSLSRALKGKTSHRKGKRIGPQTEEHKRKRLEGYRLSVTARKAATDAY